MFVNLHNTAGFRKAWNTASITGSCSAPKSEVYERAKVMVSSPPIVKPATEETK